MAGGASTVDTQLSDMVSGSESCGGHAVKRARGYDAEPCHAFPRHEQIKPHLLEIGRRHKKVARLKAERRILKFELVKKLLQWSSFPAEPSACFAREVL
jgi:hypothetical protein